MNIQQKQQVLEQIKQANNVLVAVSTNPTVDELTASVGLTLILNKLDKHATTVFSGIVPSTIEFLQPEKTIETTTDSLRDFIIALDKSKADKLRYKVEDDVVRIFITPYQTSISERDLQFSQGDFNVDLVLAIGVTNREDLDKAITAHGRILHDAMVVSLTAQNNVSDLGTLNWQEPEASSLCEMVASFLSDLPPNTADGQTATSLLTGIIAETDRFRNEKTTPYSLTLSSQLMSLGANQQLIADKLEEPEPLPEPTHIAQQRANPDQELAEIAASVSNGELDIDHEDEKKDHEDEVNKIHIDEHGNLGDIAEAEARPETSLPPPTFQPPPEAVQSPQEEDNKQKRLPDVEENEEKPESDDKGAGEHPGSSLLEKPSAKPMMSHEKVIQPPSEEDLQGDKPFNLQEAMKQATYDTVPGQTIFQKAAQPGSHLEPVTIPPHQGQSFDQLPPLSNNQVGSQQTPPDYVETPVDQQNAQPQEPPVHQAPPVYNDPQPPITQSLPPSPRPQPEEPSVPAWTPPPEPPKPAQDPPAQMNDDQSSSDLGQQTRPVVPATQSQTLRQLEEAVGSKHIVRDAPPKDETLAQLEDAVAKAADAQESAFPAPTKSVGAANVDLDVKEVKPEVKDNSVPPMPPTPTVKDPTAPPPVPPPMTPQFYDGDGNNNNPFTAPS